MRKTYINGVELTGGYFNSLDKYGADVINETNRLEDLFQDDKQPISRTFMGFLIEIIEEGENEGM